MKILVGMGRLMAAAALEHRVQHVRCRRVRIVTPRASMSANLRMIGVNLRVAALAGLFRRAAHVVRRVAVRTLVVSQHHGFAEHMHLGVARAARLNGGLGKFVRLVTSDALGVPPREERGCRHDRPLLGVARRARSNGLAGFRVLVLVARRANMHRRFAQRRVRGLDISMTTRAITGLRRGVVVGAMTAHATAGRVHHDGRRVALLCGVAAHAIACSEVAMWGAAVVCGGQARVGRGERGIRSAAVERGLGPIRRAGIRHPARRQA